MWGTGNDQDSICKVTSDWLEAAASERPEALSLEELVDGLPEATRRHVSACQACQTASRDLLESRKLLAHLTQKDDAGHPFFVYRVLAAIREKETELERTARIWAAVPRFAARLAGLAMLILLLAGTWLYEGPGKKQGTENTVEPNNGTIFEDPATVPTTKDDVLVSVLERGQ